MRKNLRSIDFHPGRRIVAAALFLGALAFLYLTLNQHDDLYTAFMKTVAAVVFTTIALAVIRTFVAQDTKVRETSAHAGPDGVDLGVTFEDRITAAVEQVSDGLKEQMGIVDGRLGRLEKAMFDHGMVEDQGVEEPEKGEE